MASETEIANLALVPLLGCNRITSLSDNQTEAIVMSASYSHCRDTVLEDRAWTFATNRVIWTPTADVVPFGFTYSYLIPTTVLKILDVSDRANGNVRSSFMWRREGDRILTNAEQIYVRVIEQVTNPNQFSTGFINTLALHLAWFNCIALTENNTLKESLERRYENALIDASTADGMQGRKEQIRANALLNAR